MNYQLVMIRIPQLSSSNKQILDTLSSDYNGMKLLLTINRATSISLIKKYRGGMPNRLQHYDEWVASWKDPHFPTYYDYFLIGETQQYDLFMPNCDKAKAAVDVVDYNFRPGVADMSRKYEFAQQNFADDLQLAEDIRKITLKSFFKGFTKSQTRTDLQRLAFWLPLGLTSFFISMYFSVFLEDEMQDVVELQPHESYFHYQAPFIKEQIAAQIEKINFLDQHARDVLKQAKQRALARANSQQ